MGLDTSLRNIIRETVREEIGAAMQAVQSIEADDTSAQRTAGLPGARVQARIAAQPRVFISPGELAEILGLERKTIYVALRRREIPGAVRVGNQWRIHRETAFNALQGKSAPRAGGRT